MPAIFILWKGCDYMKMKREWQIFADEYLIDCNGTRAYQVAYPDASSRSARAEACRVLAIPSVKEYIDKRMNEKTDARIMKQDEILMLLTSIARGEQTEQTLQLCGDGCQELVDKDALIKDRIKALELLGKRYGTFAEKIDLNVDTKESKFADILEQLGGGNERSD
jgi:phage terminase small subunit